MERIGGQQFDVPQKKRLDLSRFYGEKFKDCDNLFDYNEFAKELYERDKTCKDMLFCTSLSPSRYT